MPYTAHGIGAGASACEESAHATPLQTLGRTAHGSRILPNALLIKPPYV